MAQTVKNPPAKQETWIRPLAWEDPLEEYFCFIDYAKAFDCVDVHEISQARILEWVPFPSPGYLPDLGIEPGSPALQVDSLLSQPPGKSNFF